MPLCHQAIAVVFDLVNPARPRWRPDGDGRKAGLDETGRRWANTRTQHARKIGLGAAGRHGYRGAGRREKPRGATYLGTALKTARKSWGLVERSILGHDGDRRLADIELVVDANLEDLLGVADRPTEAELSSLASV